MTTVNASTRVYTGIDDLAVESGRWRAVGDA